MSWAHWSATKQPKIMNTLTSDPFTLIFTRPRPGTETGLNIMLRTCSPVAPRLLARQAAGSSRTFLSLSHDVQTYRIKRVVRNRPDVLYNVVADVKSYEQFIPYCEKSEITERDAVGVPQRATLEVGWNQFSETFESKLQFDEHTVIVSSVSTLYLLNLTLPG